MILVIISLTLFPVITTEEASDSEPEFCTFALPSGVELATVQIADDLLLGRHAKQYLNNQYAYGTFWTTRLLADGILIGDNDRLPAGTVLVIVSNDHISAIENINGRDASGRTHVQTATMNNDASAVEILLRKNADPNEGNPLFFAWHPKIARVLIDARANVDATDIWGNCLLHRHIEQKETLNVMLAARANVNRENYKGGTPLHLARGEICKLLLEWKANTRVFNDDHVTPLSLAVVRSDYEAFKSLLEANANVDCKALHEALPLHTMLEQLLSSRGDVEARNRNGLTLLHAATKQHDASLVRTLLQWRADISKRCIENGNQAAHFAAQFGKAESCRLLSQSRADFNARNRAGQRPVDLASEWRKQFFEGPLSII